jgi:CelD/BcsL family acetyltransferase involved in cellulose biosynthesis
VSAVQTRILRDPAEFAALREPWDRLVLGAREPCVFLLHDWLMERLRYEADRRQPAILVAERDGELVGGLPLTVGRRFGARAAELLPGPAVSHCDVLAADATGARAVLDGLASVDADYVVATGVVPDSYLASAPGLRFVERERAPYLELPDGWEAAYATRFSGHRRREHRRARRRLAEEGELAFAILRDPDEIAVGLTEAFDLHAARFEDGLDRSEFREPDQRAFHLAGARALAADGVARLATLRVGGKLVAFGYFFIVDHVAWLYRCAFDAAHAHAQPGIQLLLYTFEQAAADGARRVELLGGEHAYKLPFATGSQPLLQGVGYASTPAGQAAVASVRAAVATRIALKRHEPLRRAYVEGRRMLRHLAVV